MVRLIVYGMDYDVIRNDAEKAWKADKTETLGKKVLDTAEMYIAEKYFPTCDAEYVFNSKWSEWNKQDCEIVLYLADAE